MANVAVVAGFNQSKHQMGVDQAADGVALPNLLGTHFGLLFKDTAPEFNQVALKSRYFDVIDYIRDNNILDGIGAGAFPGFSHIIVSMSRNGSVIVNVVTDFAWWDVAPTDSVSVALPLEAGWAKEGSTVYLTNVAKRVFEKVRETFLVYL